MKLHLPNRLRNAVMACFAVVASLSATVSTGTFFAGAALVSFSSAYAEGEDDTVSADTLTWLTAGASNVWGGDAVNWSGASGNSAWVAGSAAAFSGTGETVSISGAVTAASAAVADGAWTWDLSESGASLTVSGGVTVASGATLTLSGLSTSNYNGAVTGEGTLVMAHIGTISFGNLGGVFSSTSGQTISTVKLAAGAVLEITSSNTQPARLANADNIVVEAGARFDDRVVGSTYLGGTSFTIAGTGNGAGPGGALTFGYNCSNRGYLNTSRKVVLADDATIWVRSGNTGNVSGGFESNGHTLTVTGGGTFQLTDVTSDGSKVSLPTVVLDSNSTLTLSTPTETLSSVIMSDGSCLSYYRAGNNISADVGGNRLIVNSIEASGSVTVKPANHASRTEINSISGGGTLNVTFENSSSVMASVAVTGTESYTGEVLVSHNNSGNRKALFVVDSDVFSGATVSLSYINGTSTQLGFVIGGEEGNTVSIEGLSSGEGLDSQTWLISSNKPFQTDAQVLYSGSKAMDTVTDSKARTLKLVGAGEYDFGGKVDGAVNLLMSGTGTQTFSGDMTSFNGSIEVASGRLVLSSTGSASGITLSGSSAKLSMADAATGLSGAAVNVTATAPGAVLDSALSLTSESVLTLGDTASAWNSSSAGLSLNGNVLTLDKDSLATLNLELGTVADASIVQLFTEVELQDTAGAALSISIQDGITLGKYFNAGDAVKDYILCSSGSNLYIVTRTALSDLTWGNGDGASDNNVWKNAEFSNWQEGEQSALFLTGDSVTFSDTSGTEKTVQVSGEVLPLDVTVDEGSFTWTADAASAEVNSYGSLTIEDSGALTIDSSVTASFAGGAEIQEGGSLTLNSLENWTGGISGAGTLTLNGVGEVTTIDSLLTGTLGTLALQADTTLTIGTQNAVTTLASIGAVTVSGATLELATEGDVTVNNLTADGGTVEVSGDVTLNGGTDSTVTLKNSAELNIADTLTMAQNVVLGDSEGSISFAVEGGGELVLTKSVTTDSSADDTGVYIGADSTVTVNAETFDTEVNLGVVSGFGALKLVNGSVTVSTVATSARQLGRVMVDVVTEEGNVVDVNGLDGSAIDSITLAADSRLTGVSGDITVGIPVNLAITANNVGETAEASDGAWTLIDQTGSLTLSEGTQLTLGVDAIEEMLANAAADFESVYLYLTSGTLALDDIDLWSTVRFTIANSDIDLLDMGIRVDGIEGGSLKLSGGAAGIYTVTGEETSNPADVLGYKTLSAYQATLVGADQTLTLTLEGAPTDGKSAVVNNLVGYENSAFNVVNTAADETAVVELVNSLQVIVGTEDDDPARGADTLFEGDIDTTAGAGDVNLIISGTGTLTVGGDLTTSTLTMNAGGLTLEGDANTVDVLSDAEASGSPVLTVNGTLTVDSASELSSTTLTGDGTIVLRDTLSISDDASLDGVGIRLVKSNTGYNGALVLDNENGTLSSLIGNGTLSGESSSLGITGTGGSFSGTMTGTDNLLTVAEGADFTLDRTSGSDGWSVTNNGSLNINISNPALTSGTGANRTLTLDSLVLASGSQTTVTFNSDYADTYLSLGTLEIQDGATVTLVSTGVNELPFNGSLTLAETENGITLGDDVTVDLGTSAAFKKVQNATLAVDGTSLVLQTTYYEENQYLTMASSENGTAGAEMLWTVNTGDLETGSPLKAVDDAVNALLLKGTSAAAAEADTIMAAVAGASTAALGSAFSADVERQLRAIRNRTTTMGVGQCEVNENMPYYNAWINAEGDHREMDADGTASGYTLDSWGGTVGFDVDVTPHLTMGLALTAMYGDIETDGADTSEGDFDTQYVTLFARYARNAWTHTFVATAGRADISVERTVNYGSGSYTAQGDTEGMAFGFMYEVGRVFALAEDGSVALQPVFNVSWRHSTIDAYSETGCDAGLAVDEQTSNVVTFGLGARLQAIAGENLYNRASIVEARVLAKLDAGDREGEADVRLLHGGNGSTVKSAELGAFGVEAGVGITIPLGAESGAVFADASVELRSGYTNVNGTLGYRINF